MKDGYQLYKQGETSYLGKQIKRKVIDKKIVKYKDNINLADTTINNYQSHQK